MTDDEIISIAVKTSLLKYIDNETPRRFFVSGHAELEDVVNFGRVIAATAFEKGLNATRAEVERLKARDAEWLDVGTDAHGVITRMKAELTTLRAEVDKLRAALVDAGASLAAAISLLERGGKKAAASDKMFAVMLDDYRKSLDRARAALGEEKKG